MSLHAFTDRVELAERLADTVAAQLNRALGKRGHAGIAVSGGSTPKLFFEALSKRALDWDKIAVTLVDERWVPSTNDRSNAKLAGDFLLRNKAAAATFLPLYRDTPTPDDALPDIEIALKPILPLDVVLLGMGGDGHTASFFPQGDTLDQATDIDTDRLVCAIRAAAAVEPRITLTLPILLSAGFLALHIEGADKRRVLELAQGEGPANELPIRHVLRNRDTIGIFWTD